MDENVHNKTLFKSIARQPLLTCFPFSEISFLANLNSHTQKGFLSGSKATNLYLNSLDSAVPETFENTLKATTKKINCGHELSSQLHEMDFSETAKAVLELLHQDDVGPLVQDKDPEIPNRPVQSILHTPTSSEKSIADTPAPLLDLETHRTKSEPSKAADAIVANTPATIAVSSPDGAQSPSKLPVQKEITQAQKRKLMDNFQSLAAVNKSLRSTTTKELMIQLGVDLADCVLRILELEDASAGLGDFESAKESRLPQNFELDSVDCRSLSSLLQKCAELGDSWMNAAICTSALERWSCHPLLVAVRETTPESMHRFVQLLSNAVRLGAEAFLWIDTATADAFERQCERLRVSLVCFQCILYFQQSLSSAVMFKEQREATFTVDAAEKQLMEPVSGSFITGDYIFTGLKSLKSVLEGNLYRYFTLMAQRNPFVEDKALLVADLLENVFVVLRQLGVVLGLVTFSEESIVQLIYIATSLYNFPMPRLGAGKSHALVMSAVRSLLANGANILCAVFKSQPNMCQLVLDELQSHGHKYGETDSSQILSGSCVKQLLLDGKTQVPVVCCLVLQLSQSVFPEPVYDKYGHLEALNCTKNVEEALSVLMYFFNSLIAGAVESKTADGRRLSSLKASDTQLGYRVSVEFFISALLCVADAPEFPMAQSALELVLKLLLQALVSGKSDLSVRGFILDTLAPIGAQIATEWPLSFSTGLPATSEQWTSNQVQLLVDNVYSRLTEWLYSLSLCSGNDLQFANALNAFSCKFCHEASKLGELRLPAPSVSAAVDLGALLNDQQAVVAVNREYQTQIFSLRAYFPAILKEILLNLQNSNVTMRAKALRALQVIVKKSSKTLNEAVVREAITAKFEDPSSNVRDAAVELINRFMNDKTIVRSYYSHLSAAVSDPGVAVRKRTLKMLAGLCTSSVLSFKTDFDLVVDISQRLLQRLGDSETSVSDLAARLFEEVLLPANHRLLKLRWSELSPSKRELLLPRIALIKTLAANHSYHSILCDVCKKLKLSEIFASYVVEESVDCLIGLSDFAQGCALAKYSVPAAEEQAGNVLEKSFKTLLLVAEIYPQLLVNFVSVLAPFIVQKTAGSLQQPKEIYLMALEIVQKAFSAVGDASQVSKEVGIMLQSELIKQFPQCPTVTAPYVSQALCSVIANFSKDWRIVCKILCQCFKQLNHFVKLKDTPSLAVQELLAGRIVAFAQLFQTINFDDFVFKEDLSVRFPETAQLMSRVFPETALLSALKLLARLAQHDSISISKASIQACGILWMASPSLMNHPDSLALIYLLFKPVSSLDSYYSSDNIRRDTFVGSPELPLQTLRQLSILTTAFVQLLKLEGRGDAKPKIKSSQIDMDILKGTSESFTAGTIASCIIGGLLPKIALCMLVQCTQSEEQAFVAQCFACVKLALEQGLIHPITVLPSVTALECSTAMPVLARRARRCHQHLARRYGSFIHQKNMECVVFTFLYCATFDRFESDGEAVPLRSLYEIVRPKKSKRNGLLVSMMRVWELDSISESVKQQHLTFASFLAFNLAGLPYKTYDELYIVIRYLNDCLASTGGALVKRISVLDDNSAEFSQLDSIAQLMHYCLFLKQYLRDGYRINESKVREKVPKSAEFKALVVYPDQPFDLSVIDGQMTSQERCALFAESLEEDGVPEESAEDLFLDCSSIIDSSFLASFKSEPDLPIADDESELENADESNSSFEPVLVEALERSGKRKLASNGKVLKKVKL